MSPNFYRSALLLGVLLALVCGNAAWASNDTTPCAGVTYSDVNTTLRHTGGPSCFVTYVPSTGILMLEVDVTNATSAEPWLELRGESCSGTGAQTLPTRYRQRIAAGALIEIRDAGEYHFCVTAQDPTRALDEYTIVNGFAPVALHKNHEEEDEPEPDPLAPECGESFAGLFKNHEEEDEPEPDPLAPECGESFAGLFKNHEEEDEPEPDPLAPECGESFAGLFKNHEEEDEPEPDPLAPECGESFAGLFKNHEEEDEPEPDPLACSSSRVRPAALFGDVCRTDDHGNVFRCATPLGVNMEIDAEIRDPWGTDRDLFTFVVAELARVRIETFGDGDTLGGLYDRNGNRLRVDEDGGEGANFRIVKTLSPGRYYVRVEGGRRAEGAYRLSVENLSSVK